MVPYCIRCKNRETVDCALLSSLETDAKIGGVSSSDQSSLSYRDSVFWRRSVSSNSPLFCYPRRHFLGTREDVYIVYKP